jgi:methionyl aminopeptidase
MPIRLKSPRQIAEMRDAGRFVAEIYAVLREHVVPGVTTADLDRIAEECIVRRGGIPICKGYGALPAKKGQPARPPFPATLTTNINDVICHGIPNNKERLREGDIIGIDVSVLYKGWIGDACETYAVGEIDAESRRLMEVTRRCLALGVEQARGGNHMGDIGAAIQTYAEAQGFSVVRELSGHGVGRSLHEGGLTVLHYGKPGTGVKLQPGMVFTVEPMINAGRREIKLMPDQWTIRTADGSRSAQFEHTIAITAGAPEILTLP